MIITRSWLSEYINLDDISNEQLCETLNSIGLEVGRVVRYDIPEDIVFGYVKECKKHPNADKLNICQVDVADEVLQIVCGASNVRKGLHVAVALEGAVMPGGMRISAVKLRGVESHGMICSASELSLVNINDGIIEFDQSIGNIVLGTRLRDNHYLQDTLIEIELTANRGDCLSIYGVARDLCVAFDRSIKSKSNKNTDETSIGIGKVLQLKHPASVDANLKFKVLDIKNISLAFLISLRLAQIEYKSLNTADAFTAYTTHECGVILRLYDYEYFKAQGQNDKAIVSLESDTNGFLCVQGKGRASIVGVMQEKDSLFNKNEGLAIAEASYVAPGLISDQMSKSKIERSSSFYLSSRGSNPDLKMGLKLLFLLLQSYGDIDIFGGTAEVLNHKEEKVVVLKLHEIYDIIGAKIDKKKIVNILQKLDFNLEKSQGDTFIAAVPKFRHDISNKQDIVEEILRFTGIDNIEPKPYLLKEANRLSEGYFRFKKLKHYRHKAAYNGFFETIHFIFAHKQELVKYNFDTVQNKLDIVNPIVTTMDTLRTTLMLGLLNFAGQNKKVGNQNMGLFEIGSVFTDKREEVVKAAFLYTGSFEQEGIINSATSTIMDFGHFVQLISNIIGEVTLSKATCKHSLGHPYQCADILQDNRVIGSAFRLHPTVQDNFDLQDTYMCEINFEALSYETVHVKAYSKYQSSFRDLSLLVPKTMEYATIKKIIQQSKPGEIIRFYPVDKYEDKSLKNLSSLTIRFVLQSDEKTLQDEEIVSCMDTITSSLKDKLGLELR